MGIFEEVVNGARNFACGIYKNQPGALIPNLPADVLRMAWDKLCDYPDSPGLPSPPAPPFQGGQCPGNYEVRAYVNTSVDQIVLRAIVTGPIAGLAAYEPYSYTAGFGGVRAPQILNRQGQPIGAMVYVSGNTGAFGQNVDVYSAKIFQLTPDGFVDNCGDLPANYPPANPPPPEGFTSPPTVIPLGDGDDIVIDFNFTPPSKVDFSDLIPPITVNIQNPSLKIPVTFEFNGNVNIGVPGGGSDDSDKLDDILEDLINLKDKFEEFKDEFDDLKENYDREQDRKDNKPDDESDRSRNPAQKPPGKYDVARLAYIEVVLIGVPKNAKKQLASDGTDILYCGWLAFTRGDKRLERFPIHHSKNVFFAPSEVTGYTFTLYEGYIGYAIEVTNLEG